MIEHMAKVIEDAALGGRGLQPLGLRLPQARRVQPALKFYDQALKLNPHNRGALEYLGEAYLEMDRPQDAQAMLDRLDEECQRLADSAGGQQPDCQEREDLEEALAVYRAGKS